MLKSAMPMPMPCRVRSLEVLPAVMPDVPAVPDVLPAPLPELVLPSRLPLDLPAEGRAALSAALQGPLPAGQRPQRGELVRESVPSRWDDEEISRLRGSCARWTISAGGRAASTRWSTCSRCR